MKDTVFLETLGMMIVMSGFLLVIAKKLSTPSIVLFIFAGLLLDPILGLVDLSSAFGADHYAEGANAAIAMMSHLGIALLLFLVGLELSLERIKDVGKVAAIAGLCTTRAKRCWLSTQTSTRSKWWTMTRWCVSGPRRLGRESPRRMPQTHES